MRLAVLDVLPCDAGLRVDFSLHRGDEAGEVGRASLVLPRGVSGADARAALESALLDIRGRYDAAGVLLRDLQEGGWIG